MTAVMKKLDNGMLLDMTPYEIAEWEERYAAEALEGPLILAAGAREDRDHILTTVVDPLVSNPLRWSDLTSDKQAEWSAYRTDLLNVPQQAGFPQTVTWPTEPEV
ncbi:phage tail assembly chaperone [bacterium]|nr:phage tail assembly chaperone [bacterium]